MIINGLIEELKKYMTEEVMKIITITDVDYELDYRRIVIPISGYLSTNGSGYATPSEKVSELSEMLNEERKAYPQVVDEDRLREEEINRLKS